MSTKHWSHAEIFKIFMLQDVGCWQLETLGGWSVRARNCLRYLIWQSGVLCCMETGGVCYRQHWNAMWTATSIRVRLGMGTLGLVAAWRVPPASCSVGTARSCGTAGSHGQVGPCVLVHTISYSPMTCMKLVQNCPLMTRWMMLLQDVLLPVWCAYRLALGIGCIIITYVQSLSLCENRFKRNEKWVQRSAMNTEDKKTGKCK